jgi:hypothetical protein
MVVFASLWWVWLIGLLLCGAFALWKWLTSFLGAAQTVAKVANYTLEGVHVVSDNNRSVSDKALHLRNRFVQEAAQEGMSRMRDVAMGIAAMALAAAFGVLLVISVIFQFVS